MKKLTIVSILLIIFATSVNTYASNTEEPATITTKMQCKDCGEEAPNSECNSCKDFGSEESYLACEICNNYLQDNGYCSNQDCQEYICNYCNKYDLKCNYCGEISISAIVFYGFLIIGTVVIISSLVAFGIEICEEQRTFALVMAIIGLLICMISFSF